MMMTLHRLRLSSVTRAAIHLQTADLGAEADDLAGQLQRQRINQDPAS